MSNRVIMTLVLLAGCAVGVQAAPIAFPGSGTSYVYTQNFDSALGSEWTLNGWVTPDIFPGGSTQVTGNGTAHNQVSPSSPSGLSYPATFPLPAIKPADSFANHGFASKWLVNDARTADDGTATARVEFNNLPTHSSIDLDFLLAVGDSIDTGTSNMTHYDGPKTIAIKVDGVLVWDFLFSSGGGNLAATNGIVKLVNAGNLNTYYREQWNDNAGAGPAHDGDRAAMGWTLDSAYDMGGFTTFTAIAHTADTLTVEFIHNLSSSYTDEYHGIDNVAITLNGVIPEPGALTLLALAAAALARRK